ncbi:MAG: flagellar assembly protein FliH [Desulfovibrio sp.]|nr:flagellar assembly protein FliH [Desulfovibrio sp.]
MASEQLRKKWGTIFMGERETTPQELEAMREPVMRERRQRQEQEDYLARVRTKAEERAREILGAAYAERQKVLAEAREEAEAQARQAAEAAQALQAQAQAVLADAEAERDKARVLREEAVQVLENRRQEGFQQGMEQAGTELKEFRADVARMLGGVLRSLEGQRAAMCDAWREELVEVTRVAVEAGTGWLLQTEHQQVLRSLVLESLHLLEDRVTVTVRVHPDDEQVVGDMFRDARERVPELRQWIVEGDSTLEPGDIVAESVSGSVENLRSYYREMVGNILEHLTLPQSPAEAQAEADLAETVACDTAQLDEVVRAAEPVPEPEPAAQDTVQVDQSAEQDMPGVSEQEPSMDDSSQVQAPMPDRMSQATVTPASEVVQERTADGIAPSNVPDNASEDGAFAPDDDLFETPEAGNMPPSVPDSDGQIATSVPEEPLSEDDLLPVDIPDVPPPSAPVPPTQIENPSLAELEDELFPLPEEEHPQPESGGNVFVDGGFLSGSQHQG